jgi:hypothetical protein
MDSTMNNNGVWRDDDNGVVDKIMATWENVNRYEVPGVAYLYLYSTS